MPSPFPGMDPYLEESPWWELFHAWFVRKLAEQSLPKAHALGCLIDVERDVYHKDPNGEVSLIGEPDETVAATSSASWTGAEGATAVALAEPKAVNEVVLDPATRERHQQDYLVVREADKLERVLAVAELLSPANKGGTYMPRYREKRLRFLTARVHFMEIDLRREGDNPSRRLFPDLPATSYFIFVARKNPMGRREEGYPIRMQDPLPVIGLPLGPPRPDLPLDLPSAFQAAYDLTVQNRRVRYDRSPPGPQLDHADAQWLEDHLREVRGRSGAARR